MEWKTICYNDKYEISDTGLVRRKDSGHILQGCIAQGYRSVKLTFENSKQQRFKSHRLVAEHFIDNPDPKNKTFVHHIDGNKLNNVKENLKWVTPRENNLYYYQLQQAAKKERKRINSQPVPVIHYDMEGRELGRYNSMNLASKATGISNAQISRSVYEGRIVSNTRFKKFLND